MRRLAPSLSEPLYYLIGTLKFRVFGDSKKIAKFKTHEYKSARNVKTHVENSKHAKKINNLATTYTLCSTNTQIVHWFYW